MNFTPPPWYTKDEEGRYPYEIFAKVTNDDGREHCIAATHGPIEVAIANAQLILAVHDLLALAHHTIDFLAQDEVPTVEEIDKLWAECAAAIHKAGASVYAEGEGHGR